MKQTKTIPFNWDTYQQNKDKYTLVLRDGRKVDELIRFSQTPNNGDAIHGLVNGEVFSWDDDGSYFSNIAEHDRADLMLQYEYEEEAVGRWVKVYKIKAGGRLIISEQSFNTKSEAMKSCNGLMDVEHVGVINLNDIINVFANNE